MKNTIYLYSQPSLLSIIKEIFFDFEVLTITLDVFDNSDFTHQNIVLFDAHDFSKINESVFKKNNVVICFSKKPNNLDETKYYKTKFFYKNINVKKFFDEVKTYFIARTVIFKNNKIFDEKIINLNNELSALLTPLEKEILTVLFEKKQINREYLLEKVLKIKKNIETKTIESHLTRIRKKLIKIKSNIHISSKDDKFYIDG